MLTADIGTLLLSLESLELETSCGSEYGTASLYDIGNIMSLHIEDLFIQKALISLFDSLYLKSSCKSNTDNASDGCVHSGRVTAACKYADCFNFLSHIFLRVLTISP